jgi:hypothetical protein
VQPIPGLSRFGVEGKLRPVLRLFSMFPTGTAGIALLILRVAVGALILVDMIPAVNQSTLGWGVVGLAIGASLLSLGILTPYVCLILCLAEGIEIVSYWKITELQVAILFLLTAALGLLGPGAYSVDSWLFGRRRIVLPEKEQDHGGHGFE